MNQNEQSANKKPTRRTLSKVLYIAAAIVALLGIALLADNIYLFKTAIDQYTAQGYPADTVMKSLIPMQLLPGIFEPVAVYGGIALALLGIGSVNKKIPEPVADLSTEETVETGAEEDNLQAAKPESMESEEEKVL